MITYDIGHSNSVHTCRELRNKWSQSVCEYTGSLFSCTVVFAGVTSNFPPLWTIPAICDKHVLGIVESTYICLQCSVTVRYVTTCESELLLLSAFILSTCSYQYSPHIVCLWHVDCTLLAHILSFLNPSYNNNMLMKNMFRIFFSGTMQACSMIPVYIMAKGVCTCALTKTVMLSMPSVLVKRISVYSISFSVSDAFRMSRDWERFKPTIYRLVILEHIYPCTYTESYRHTLYIKFRTCVIHTLQPRERVYVCACGWVV